MGGACGKYGLQERCIRNFDGRPEKGDYLEILVFSGSGKGQVANDCEAVIKFRVTQK
jgi:hypothetical protein